MPNEHNDSETEEEPEGPQTVMSSGGPGRDEMVDGYIPGEEDWLAKTNLDVSDPGAVAALGSFGTIYPEVEDLQPMIDNVLDDLFRGRTSVKGKSREEYRSIFEAMFGKSSDGDQSTAMRLIAPEDD